MGAALVLFFVLLLAFAEVIGFTAAYILASAAIAGLNTAYSAAVLAELAAGGVHRRPARRALCRALRPAEPRSLLAADRLAAAVRGAGRGDVRDAADRLGRAKGSRSGSVTLSSFAASRRQWPDQPHPPKRIFPTSKVDARAAEHVPSIPQTESAAYKLAFQDTEFLLREDLRPVRFQLELLKPELFLNEAEHRLDLRLLRLGADPVARHGRRADRRGDQRPSSERSPSG